MFFYEKHLFDTSTIHLLNYKPYPFEQFVDLLDDEEHKRFYSFRSEKRRYEYLSTRILKEQIFPQSKIRYNDNGQPTINEQKHVSISHARYTTAIAVSNHHPIGIDIEPLGEKAQRLYTKFLNEHECHILDTNDALLMTRAWSCKETLLKLTGAKNVIFKRNLLIEEYDGKEVFRCTIKLPSKQSVCVSLTSMLLNDIILTVNSSYFSSFDAYDI